jgi:apolipoprotein N-acyltransferase
MRTRILDAALVVVGGVLYATSFPPYDYDLGAWICLVPLLAVLARVGAWGAFAAGATYGAVFFAGIVPWVFEAVAQYFGAGVFAAAGFSVAICVLYVSGYVGLFAVAARTLLHRGRWRAFVGVPALWVTYELARATLLTGLPWELLGHSQWRHVPLIQVADFGGVYALSFVVAAVNVGIYVAVRSITRTAHVRCLARAGGPLAVALALVVACLVYGATRLDAEHARPARPSALVALAQGNLPANPTWERRAAERDLIAYVDLSRGIIASARPDLLVWPEYAVTLYPDRDTILLPALGDIARRTTAGLVFGAPRLTDAPRTQYFNAAYHLAPRGTLASYDKIHLVPFAEYRPAPLAEAFAGETDGEFSAGTSSTVFETAAGRIGVLICYEVIFPDLARWATLAGAEILVNLSNDGWLDRANLGAGAQHLSMAVFRAVENRRYVARAAASGISGFIDPTGRPFALLDAGRSGTTTGEVSPRRDLSVYTRVGDVLALTCAVVGLALVAVPRRGAARSDA